MKDSKNIFPILILGSLIMACPRIKGLDYRFGNLVFFALNHVQVCSQKVGRYYFTEEGQGECNCELKKSDFFGITND